MVEGGAAMLDAGSCNDEPERDADDVDDADVDAAEDAPAGNDDGWAAVSDEDFHLESGPLLEHKTGVAEPVCCSPSLHPSVVQSSHHL